MSAHASVCPSGKYPVSSHFRTDYYRSDGTHISAANVDSSCREYRIQKPLIINFSKNRPADWPHKNEKFKHWTEREKAEISKILNNLPAILTQIGKLHLYRASKSESVDNPATNAPFANIITIYDSINGHNKNRVLAHELAHILYNNLSPEELNSYHSIAEWKKDRGTFTTKRISFTQPDGIINPEEDFANNVESFIFNKTEFGESKTIPQWLKKLFGE